VKDCRRITDVWDIINIFIQKLPLLDEKDMEAVPDAEKETFEKKYGQSHDRFYEAYSEDIFECVKRLFSESLYYDSTTNTHSDKHILDLMSSCHPEYKKRVLLEMEEQILENNNKFLLSIFHPGLRPSKNFEATLRGMIENGNIENEENMTLDISVNTILSIDMDIDSIKLLIRKYSKKNNFKFLKQIMASLTNYIILFEPLKSTLDYLVRKPEIVMSQ
jgi:ribosomal protein L31